MVGFDLLLMLWCLVCVVTELLRVGCGGFGCGAEGGCEVLACDGQCLAGVSVWKVVGGIRTVLHEGRVVDRLAPGAGHRCRGFTCPSADLLKVVLFAAAQSAGERRLVLAARRLA